MPIDEGDCRSTRGIAADHADSRGSRGLVFVSRLVEIAKAVGRASRAATQYVDERLQKIHFYVVFRNEVIQKTYTIDRILFRNIQVTFKKMWDVVTESVNILGSFLGFNSKTKTPAITAKGILEDEEEIVIKVEIREE